MAVPPVVLTHLSTASGLRASGPALAWDLPRVGKHRAGPSAWAEPEQAPPRWPVWERQAVPSAELEGVHQDLVVVGQKARQRLGDQKGTHGLHQGVP